MRQSLLDALVFPRRYVRASLFFTECIHGGNYHEGEQVCQSCQQKAPCRWSYLNDECRDPQRKTTAELQRSLEFCLDYIDTDAAYMGHNIGTCTCQTCVWIKNAENLLNLYKKFNKSAHRNSIPERIES